jgi:hypothetical protein
MALAAAVWMLGGSSAAAGPAPNALPDASFGFFPSDPVAGQTVTFVSYTCDPDGQLAEQAWDLDGDGSFDDALGGVAAGAFAAGSHLVGLQVTDREGALAVRSRTLAVAPGRPEYALPRPFKPPLLSPFPVVRLAGVLTRTGARVRRLSVRAPVCSRVTVRCRGRSCPRRRSSKLMGRRRMRFDVFERRLRAGTTLEVLVSKRDRIGKYTRFRIRRGRPPRRLDRCLRFGDTRGTPCPRD